MRCRDLRSYRKGTSGEVGFFGGFDDDVEDVLEGGFGEEFFGHFGFFDQARKHVGSWFPIVTHLNRF